MFEAVNRLALIISPKQPLSNWIKEVAPEKYLEAFNGSDSGTVYLVQEFNYTDDVEKFLKKFYKIIFETELATWCVDEACWPQKRDWHIFEEWFDVKFQSRVLDLGKGKINK